MNIVVTDPLNSPKINVESEQDSITLTTQEAGIVELSIAVAVKGDTGATGPEGPAGAPGTTETPFNKSGLGTWGFDSLNIAIDKELGTNSFKLFEFGSDSDGNVFNGVPFGCYWNNDNQALEWRDIEGYYYPQTFGPISADYVSSPLLYLTGQPVNRVPYLGVTSNMLTSPNFTFDGNKLSLAGATSLANALRLGSDVDIFRGSTNRLDLANANSLYIPNSANGLAVGTTPNSSHTCSFSRGTSSALASSDYALHTQMTISHGNAASFPAALRARADVSAGANTVLYHAAFQALGQVTNSHSGSVPNFYGCDLSARWNTQQAGASSQNLIGGAFIVTSDYSTAQGSLGSLVGGDFSSGLPVANTLVNISSAITAGRFRVNVPTSGASGSIATNIDLFNHSVGAGGSAINVASMIRVAPLTANYTSGTKKPILFNGANTNHNEIGIWWGTDGNSVSLGRGGNLYLTTNSSFGVATVGQGLRIAEGANAKMGTVTLVAGVATVINSSVTASSRIFLTSQVDGGTPGFLRISSRVVGTSFVITSSSNTDTSTVAYEIKEPA